MDVATTTVLFRLFVVAAFFVMVWGIYRYSRSRVGGYFHVFLKFCFFAYTITYFLGLSLIFITNGEILERYFIGYMYVPELVPFWTIWLMGCTPYLAYFLIATMPEVKARRSIEQVVQSDRQNSSFSAVMFTVVIVLGFSIAVLSQKMMPLINNAFAMTGGGIGGIVQLYEMREAVFSTIRFHESGVLYGTLPALSACLLFYKGRNQQIVRVFAVLIALLTIILNLGMFQIAPISAFVLIVIFMHLHLAGNRSIDVRRVALFLGIFVLFGIYNAMKSDGANFQQFSIFVDVLLRMPSATPYLFEMKTVSDAALPPGSSLPTELGLFMFPGQDALQGFIAMPQPGFLVDWFESGPAVSFVMQLVALLVPGWLARIFVSGMRTQMDFIGVGVIYAIAHYIYYILQTGYHDLLLSGYSIFFPLLPLIVYAMINGLVRPMRAPI